jgi:FMN-dependent oxidoreductase (nitrilotriacetate monooxygenase family)
MVAPMPKKQVHLGFVGLAPGSHEAAWRHPSVHPASHLDVDFFRDMIAAAERAKFDLFFLADGLGGGENRPDIFERCPLGLLEPMTLLASLAASTRHIGLVATISTSANSPFQIARVMGTLDHLSRGRAGWNLVTSVSTLEDWVGIAPVAGKEQQYARGEEVLAGVLQLWDGWHEHSMVLDQAKAKFLTMEGARFADLNGKHFRLHGLMHLPRPPQGRPIITQAGVSERGRELAARSADLVFTVQPTHAAATAFYRDMKARVERAGRAPDSVVIMPGLSVYVGRTKAEAEDFRADLQSYIDPVGQLHNLSRLTGADLGGIDIDLTLDDIINMDNDFKTEGTVGFQKAFKVLGGGKSPTVRQIIEQTAASRGHVEVVGSVADVCDLIEEWIDTQACDGFNVMTPLFPKGFALIEHGVVPELQRRGRFRTAYEAETLRGLLGVPYPTRPSP